MSSRNFTNQLELPEWVVRGLTYSNYNKDKVKFDISCTTLIDGPLKNHLTIVNKESIVELLGILSNEKSNLVPLLRPRSFQNKFKIT